MRDSEDTKRYKKLYGIDNNEYSFADLTIDTSCNSPEQIVSIILDKLKEKDLIEEV